ncbi:MAG: hypothetical protein K6T75_07890 [Acetobacteraceae bacterium]|nr:hypothetical protein [Acetobacteraceae bacterium]
MRASDRRVVVFFGSLGSGKTEAALNYALWLARTEPVRLVDLDLVTPLFRSRDAEGALRRRGVMVAGPPPELWLADLPVLPAQVRAALAPPGPVVLDVGGGEAGSRVMGCLAAFLVPGEYEAWFVVNPYRPFTRTPGGIASSLRAMERAAGFSATGLVSNPHLGAETRVEEVLSGHRVVREAASEVGLAIRFLCVTRDRALEVARSGVGDPVFPLTRFMKAPWERSAEAQEG